MKELKYNVSCSRQLSDMLKDNGQSHLKYKMYTSMDKALGYLLTGDMYLTNGQKWNDIEDRKSMERKNTYGKCFSWSTKENIAMWMLYGGDNGRAGAMIDFPSSIMKYYLNVTEVELGYFDNNGKFKIATILSKDCFNIYLTDVIYTDFCKNDMVKLTKGDEHITVDKSMIEEDDIFTKNFAWAYERETRLIIKLKKDCYQEATKNEWFAIRIKTPDKFTKQLRKDKLYRSPVYNKSVENGIPSTLTGEVHW